MKSKGETFIDIVVNGSEKMVRKHLEDNLNNGNMPEVAKFYYVLEGIRLVKTMFEYSGEYVEELFEKYVKEYLESEEFLKR